MEWRETVLEINSMSPQKLNYIAERYSSWLDKMVRGRRGYARIIPFAERVTKLEVLIEKTKDPRKPRIQEKTKDQLECLGLNHLSSG